MIIHFMLELIVEFIEIIRIILIHNFMSFDLVQRNAKILHLTAGTILLNYLSSHIIQH